MSRIVLDASVAAASLLDEDLDAPLRSALDSVRREGAFVPPLWHYEVRNTLLVAYRRGRISELAVRLSVDTIRNTPTETDWDADLDATMELAFKHRLTFYDALYLELARRRQLPLASLDAALVRAVRAEGLDVIA